MPRVSRTTRSYAVLTLLAGAALAPARSSAQTAAFAVGDTVQFNFARLPDQRLGVVITAPTQQGANLVQLQVLELPSQDHPQGHGAAWVNVEFVHPLSRGNAASTAVKPLGWFLGRWSLTIVAPTVDRAKADGYLYRREESGARMGFVQIDPDGTFTWKVLPSDPASAWIRGRWRPASASEPGARVVLLGGEDRRDWVVYGSSSTIGGRDQVKLWDPTNHAQRLGTRG